MGTKKFPRSRESFCRKLQNIPHKAGGSICIVVATLFSTCGERH
uniref:Uncharacterized protein n=1 Tax=Siphoviridae sp. ctnMb19 TaxID=2825659 RepID=A0A8S5NTD9_9CAUD|nr:MAG TPA: hypothetical protein [Siphoviridae sp. ctnMb19]DAE81301.1 MAG TPA: hypothetical protein [Bacteriophage sp.]DAO26107.1 MAG TPA: hypothetical protein [Bacteriophage sp.]DAW84146.1 MAG TPA: hypothetical protein [Bacteriophage sp.]